MFLCSTVHFEHVASQRLLWRQHPRRKQIWQTEAWGASNHRQHPKCLAHGLRMPCYWQFFRAEGVSSFDDPQVHRLTVTSFDSILSASWWLLSSLQIAFDRAPGFSITTLATG
eukprot:s121_g4.t1